MTRKVFPIVFAVAVLILILPIVSLACGCLDACAGVGTNKQCAELRLKQYGGAFRGKVVEVREGKVAGTYIARFEVMKSWKYRVEKYVDVSSFYNDGANCGTRFQVGEEYFLFARLSSSSSASVSECDIGAIEFEKFYGKARKLLKATPK